MIIIKITILIIIMIVMIVMIIIIIIIIIITKTITITITIITITINALNLPRQSTYKDTIKLQYISTGQYANTIASKYKINTTNMNQLL